MTCLTVTGNTVTGNVVTTGTSGDLTMTGGAITGVGSITSNGFIAINSSAGITTTQLSFNIANTNATTINFASAANTINIGANTGTLTLRNPILVGSNATQNLYNTTATTINFGGAATTLNIGANTGNTTLNNNLIFGSAKTISTTGSVTSNALTAFIAGDAAISGVALQIPREGGIRNVTNGVSNMYIDVSTGGTTHGQFQFRSANTFTNVLTMSPTAFNVSTDATVTARTPSLGRLPWNSAIDTELTIDNMRLRINNTAGNIYPKVIGNGSSRNLAWTGVGAISGSAVTQVGSTGVIVADNAWTTLYNSQSMNSAGDTVTVTLQDKAAGRIYRITFMRSDDGSTTGYNIIAERIL